MNLPKAFVMPLMIVQMLTKAISDKQYRLMMNSETKQFYQMQAAQKLSEVSQKYADKNNVISNQMSEITRKQSENSLVATNFDGEQAAEGAQANATQTGTQTATVESIQAKTQENGEAFTQQYQDLNSQRQLLNTEQETETNRIMAEATAKETPLDMQIKMDETQVKAMEADRDGWQKVLDDACKGGSS